MDMENLPKIHKTTLFFLNTNMCTKNTFSYMYMNTEHIVMMIVININSQYVSICIVRICDGIKTKNQNTI